MDLLVGAMLSHADKDGEVRVLLSHFGLTARDVVGDEYVQVTPTGSPRPKRSPLRLSLAEREEISRGLAGGESLRSIAGRLGRAPSTVSREVPSNGGARRYRACGAERAALGRMRRLKPAKLARCERLRRVVEAKLELRWLPQQISGWLVGASPRSTVNREGGP